VQTLLQIILFWPQSKLRPINLYDELSLIMERGATLERVNYLSAVLERDVINQRLAQEKEETEELRSALSYERWFGSRLVLTFTGLLVTCVLAVISPLVLGAARVDVKVSNWTTVWAMLAILVTLFLGGCSIAWTMHRHPSARATNARRSSRIPGS
jgi:hypothetical protein